MPDYASALYWQERYSHDPKAQFDWYLTWEELRPALAPLLTRAKEADFEVFIPGCGNSTLPARMYADGYTNISCIDISSVVIAQVRDRYADLTEMDFSVMDATALTDVPDACFDLTVDKALMDSILCGEDAFTKVSALLKEQHRLLKPGGTYVAVSYAAPASRLPYFAVCDWKVTVREVAKPSLEGFKDVAGAGPNYYVYMATKGPVV